MRSTEVAFLIQGAMGGLLEVTVVVVDYSDVACAAAVGIFAVISYLFSNLEFSFATSADRIGSTSCFVLRICVK